jgi:acyl-CoA synthetase (AMP-forming)/AMP-acid ligase II
MFDTARFAGAQVFLQALLSGVLLLPEPEAPLEQRIAFLAEQGCKAISATATMWRKIMMTEAADRLRLERITLGGEIADAGILRLLAERFPAAGITHIYASTEAGTVFSVHDGQAGFPLSYLSSPPRGVELKLADGRLFVRTSPIARRYLNQPDFYASADGFVDTGDAVRIEGDRCLFAGREHGCINVGGNKVYPEEVEQVLIQHEGVRAARVFGQKNPVTGQIVAAEIVPAGEDLEPAKLRQSLLAFSLSRMPRWQAPALIRFVPAIAVDASGKVSRRAAS